MWRIATCCLILKNLILKQNDVHIIIPAFNEASVIGTTLHELITYGYSIVVVDDCSADNTAEIVKQLPVSYIRHKVNMGQGAALQTGISYALQKGAAYFVTFDADGQHSPEDIDTLLEKLGDSSCDFVFGTRFSGGVKTEATAGRKIVLQVARYLNFLLTGILLTDAHNGLRAFSRKAAEKINITENRMAHATEFLILVKKNKLRYTEAPVRIRYTSYSRQKGQKNFHSFKVLQDILLHKFFR